MQVRAVLGLSAIVLRLTRVWGVWGEVTPPSVGTPSVREALVITV